LGGGEKGVHREESRCKGIKRRFSSTKGGGIREKRILTLYTKACNRAENKRKKKWAIMEVNFRVGKRKPYNCRIRSEREGTRGPIKYAKKRKRKSLSAKGEEKKNPLPNQREKKKSPPGGKGSYPSEGGGVHHVKSGGRTGTKEKGGERKKIFSFRKDVTVRRKKEKGKGGRNSPN